MKKHSKAGPPAPPKRRRQAGSTQPADAPADETRAAGWHPDRTDIERPNEAHRSVEASMRDAQAGGIEAPEPLSQDKKATPFE